MLAGKYAPAALNTLVSVMKASESAPARVAAAKELLDRAYGKAPQAIVGGGEGTPPVAVQFIELVGVRPQ